VTDDGRPLPQPSAVTQPFWDGARRHELWIQRCQACGTHLFYPRRLCTTCGSADLDWVEASGRGSVFTYTIARRATHPAFADRVPYVIAVVELEEGPKLTTNIVGVDPDDVRIDMPVVVTYEDADDVSLVNFRPA
jgi:uncharacterized OB-fold protein